LLVLLHKLKKALLRIFKKVFALDISQLISRHARYRPEHLAVIYQDQRLTYFQFNQRVNRLAHALLGLGVVKGAKVATILPNCLELLEIYWACAKIGAVVVPMSPLLRGTGLSRLLNDSDTQVVVINAGFIEHLQALRPDLPTVQHYILTDAEDVAGYLSYCALTAAAPDHDPTGIEISPDDPYNIIYSSGTTGLPKGIVLTHQIRALYGALFGAAYRITPESVILHAGNIIFNGAFLTLMPAFFCGATYILQAHFDPQEVLVTAQREQVTHIKMVPSQLIGMLSLPDFNAQTLPHLQMIGSVGAPLHRRYKEELNQRLPKCFYELYGLTEGFMTILDRNDNERKLDSVGCPTHFTQIRIVGEDGRDKPTGEVGEIVGRSPLLMKGYYKRPDLTAEAIRDGWLYSGDMGYLDEEGFLFLVDRKKDLIISGGVNVYPRDIEEVITQHPAVKEVAVFGAPDEKWGETPIAAVILKQAESISAEDLMAWINAHVEARYQRVSQVLLKEDFPRNAAGKTLKRTLRQAYLDMMNEA